MRTTELMAEEKLRSHIHKAVPIDDPEFEFIKHHFTLRNFKKRDYLIREGERVPDSYYVVSGLLKLTHLDESGKEHIISFAMEDWWECDFGAYLKEEKATMSLQCLEDCTVFCLSLDGYRTLCSKLQKMERFFLIKSTAGHVAAQQRILSFLTLDARARYEHLLLRHPALLQRVSRTLLASYLGVSRETLSRLFK